MSLLFWVTIALLIVGSAAAGWSGKTVAEIVFRTCMVSLVWIAAMGSLR
jgi:hypothetical protein